MPRWKMSVLRRGAKCPSTAAGLVAELAVANPGAQGGGGTVGACCTPIGGCVMTTHAACEAIGGTFHPNTPCGPDVCGGPVMGACCGPDGGCAVTTHAFCESIGGTFHPNTPCGPDVCGGPVMGACCG